jgi:hypothetical protein
VADAGGAVGPLLAAAFEQGGGSLRVIDAAAGLPAASNMGVLDLASAQPLLPAQEPLAFTAVVRNWSDATRTGVECRFFLDDVQRAVQHVDLAPQGTATAELRLRIDTPGPHHLGVALERDELPFDDGRTLAFEVREHIAVLLVDGAPGGAEALSGATGFLALALDPEGATRRFEPTVWDAGRLDEGAAQLGGFDAIVLANVGGLSTAAAEALAGAVQGGTPLLVFTGDLTEPAFYNERLPQLGLTLPAQIGAMAGDPRATAVRTTSRSRCPTRRPARCRCSPTARWPCCCRCRSSPGARCSRSRAAACSRPSPTRPARPRRPSSRDARAAAACCSSAPPPTPRGRCCRATRRCGCRWCTSCSPSLLAADPGRDEPARRPVADARRRGPAALGAAHLAEQGGHDRRAARLQPAGAGRSRLELAGLPLEEAGAYLLEVNTAQGAQRIALAAVPDAREGDLRSISQSELGQALSGVEWQLGGDELDEEQAAAAG